MRFDCTLSFLVLIVIFERMIDVQAEQAATLALLTPVQSPRSPNNSNSSFRTRPRVPDDPVLPSHTNQNYFPSQPPSPNPNRQSTSSSNNGNGQKKDLVAITLIYLGTLFRHFILNNNAKCGLQLFLKNLTYYKTLEYWLKAALDCIRL